jgi:4-hydroxy-2-oxoheptanedioate aldolase
MQANQLAQRLKRGEIALGLCNMYGAPGIIEGMCKGWDFVWIDGQHGQFSYQAILHSLRTAEAAGIETLLRAPGHEPGNLGLYADGNPSALMIPVVNRVEQAQAVIDALRFPPLGNRSYGGRRMIDLYGRDYPTDSELLVVIQIESAEGVENVEELSQVEGVDALFFGADDMRMALGLAMSTPVAENKGLREAMEKTARVARDHGKYAGCVAPNEASMRMAVEMGYQIIVGGGDIQFLRTGAASRLDELRGPANVAG